MSIPIIVVVIISIIAIIISILLYKKLTHYKSLVKALTTDKNELQKNLQDLHDTQIQVQTIIKNLEIPAILTDHTNTVTTINQSALQLLLIEESLIKGKGVAEMQSFITAAQNQNSFQIKVQTIPLLSHSNLNGTLFLLYDNAREKQLEEMKFDFVSLVAHQLRTPLTILKGYLAVLQNPILQKLTHDESYSYAKAVSGADRLSYLVENLLKTTTLVEGRYTLNLKPADLRTLIINAATEMQPFATQKNLQIAFETQNKPLPPVLADLTMIITVLTNLIQNAIEHSYGGNPIIIHTEYNQSEVLVSVKDSGEGIPSLAMPYLFSKFYKVPNNLIQTSSGVGLGLYFCKTIIDAHKGKIWINSIQGKGATASFSLPIHAFQVPA